MYYSVARAIIEAKQGVTKDGRLTVQYDDLANAARARGYGLPKPTAVYREVVRLGGVKVSNGSKGTRFAFTPASLEEVAREAAQFQPHQHSNKDQETMRQDILVKNQPDHPPLVPGDFAHKAIFRTLAGDERLSLYGSLRVIEYDPLAAFSAALGEVFTGRVEIILTAMEVLERTSFFSTLTSDIEEAMGEEALRKEYDRRIAECSGLATDAAMQMRLLMERTNFKSYVFTRGVEREKVEYDALMGQRRSQGDRARDRETGMADASRAHTLEHAALMRGKLSEDQLRNGERGPDEYDVNTQRPVWN